MQYNHIISLKKVRNTPLLSTFIKVLIFLFVAAYIFFSLQNKDQLDRDFKASLVQIFKESGWWISLPVLLFPLNWGLEALKWKFLTQKIERISFARSFKGVVTGVTLGFATPLGLGDYVGRILQLKQPDRSKGIGAVFVSRISQFYITLVCGSTSLILLAYKTKNLGYFDNAFDVFVLLVLILNLIFISLFLFHKHILAFLRRGKLFRRIFPYIEIIDSYDYNELAFVLLLSFLRYAVFTFQFIMILYFFEVSSNIGLLLSGVNFIFLVKSVIPTFFDLGVRESAAVYFFSNFTMATDQVIFASLSLWAINIVIPAFIGLFLIFNLKIFARA